MISTDGAEAISDGRKRWLQRIDTALDTFDKPIVVFALLIPVFLQWIVPLVRSRFWLDETVTWWVTDGGLAELVKRCTVWPGSILYTSFILLLRDSGIHREWLLRLPSLLAVFLAAAILFDLARRWFSKRAAIAATVFFCAHPWVSFAAADARPYAFGLVMVVAATWLLLRWLETQNANYAKAYGAAAALILHFHMLFATALVFHVIFLAWAVPRNRRAIRQAAIAASILIVLAAPLLPQYLSAYHGRASHNFAPPPTVSEFFQQFLPTLSMVAAVLIAACFPRLQAAQHARIAPGFILLAILWAAVPLCLLYAISRCTGTGLFIARYCLPCTPGFALSFGTILEYLSHRLRTGLVLLIFLTPWARDCWRSQFASHTQWGNWAAAIDFVDRENAAHRIPALIRSPFPESDYWDWQNEPMDDSAIYAPLAYYRSRANWSPLPRTFTQASVNQIDLVAGSEDAVRNGLFFVTLDDRQSEDPYFNYLLHQCGKGPLEAAANFEGVRVFRWQCSVPGVPPAQRASPTPRIPLQ